MGTSLRILIRAELGHPGALIGDDQIYNVIVITNEVIIKIYNNKKNWFWVIWRGISE